MNVEFVGDEVLQQWSLKGLSSGATWALAIGMDVVTFNPCGLTITLIPSVPSHNPDVCAGHRFNTL